MNSAVLPVGTGLWTVPVTCDGPESRRYLVLRTTVRLFSRIMFAVRGGVRFTLLVATTQ